VSHANERLPLVSIIINNYNYGHFLGKAIDSSLKQTYPCVEVIVVDDGSTDNSREIIGSYKEQIIPVLKDNGGQGSAFNAGFAASRGDIICMLDSDDIFLPEKVAEIVNVFKQYQDIEWCFHRLQFVEANTGVFLKLSHESGSRQCDFREHLKKGKLPFTSPATSGLCFTRSLLQKILPMPEASGVNVSDHYLKVTALALNKGFFLDEQLACLRIHSNNTYTLKDDKQQLKARVSILTAYWLRYNWPFLTKFGNKLLAKGISTYWKNGDIEVEYAEKIKSYLSNVSLIDRIEIGLRAIYYRFKF
jgi:glycosyltransferase involved in cell wall biosynthesis